MATKDKVDENLSSVVCKEPELVEDQNQVKQSAIILSECNEQPVSHDSHTDESLEENEKYTYIISYIPASSTPDSQCIQYQLPCDNTSSDNRSQGMQ